MAFGCAPSDAIGHFRVLRWNTTPLRCRRDRAISVRMQDGNVTPRQCAHERSHHLHVDRRSLLLTACSLAIGAVGTNAFPSQAAVNFDIDRFGDKELKVAAINSVKQSCRNILQERPDLLPAFFTLSLHDALTYNAETNEGGPNGSLRLELDREENAELLDAVKALTDVRASSRRDMSFADTFAFAGAVAVEVTGGPRIKIQLGRDDAKTADPRGKAALFTSKASASDLIECFNSAGLRGARDVVLIHGGLGSLADIAQTRMAKLEEERALRDDEDDVDLEDSVDDVTYGKVETKKRGPVLVSSNVSRLTLGGAKFSNAYLKSLLDAKKKGKTSGLSDRDRNILSSSETLPYVEEYASNNSKFANDVADLFEKITLLGSQYESLKFSD